MKIFCRISKTGGKFFSVDCEVHEEELVSSIYSKLFQASGGILDTQLSYDGKILSHSQSLKKYEISHGDVLHGNAKIVSNFQGDLGIVGDDRESTEISSENESETEGIKTETNSDRYRSYEISCLPNKIRVSRVLEFHSLIHRSHWKLENEKNCQQEMTQIKMTGEVNLEGNNEPLTYNHSLSISRENVQIKKNHEIFISALTSKGLKQNGSHINNSNNQYFRIIEHLDLIIDSNVLLVGIIDSHRGKSVAKIVSQNIGKYIKSSINEEFKCHDTNSKLQEKRPGDLSYAFSNILKSERMRVAVIRAFKDLDKSMSSSDRVLKDGCSVIILLLFSNGLTLSCYLGLCSGYLYRDIPVVIKESLIPYNNVSDINSFKDSKPYMCVPLNPIVHACWIREESKRIERGGGFITQNRINGIMEASRSFGDFDLKVMGVICTPDIVRFDLQFSKREFMVLGNEIFWETFSTEEVYNFLKDKNKKREMMKGESENLRLRESVMMSPDIIRSLLKTKKSVGNMNVIVIGY